MPIFYINLLYKTFKLSGKFKFMASEMIKIISGNTTIKVYNVDISNL